MGEGQMARTVSVAAVVGTTTAGMPGPLCATGTSRPIAGTISAFAFPQLKHTAGWLLFDPTFIQSAYNPIFNMRQKENGSRYTSRFVRMPTERLPGSSREEM